MTCPAPEVLYAAFEALPIGVIITSVDGVICWANSRAANLAGCSSDEIVGLPGARFDEHYAAGTPLRNASGETTHFMRTSRGLTGNRFRRIVEDTDAAYFSIGLDGAYKDVNPAFLRMHGFSGKNEILGRHFSEVQNPEDLPDAEAIVQRLVNGERASCKDFTRRCKDGSIKYHTFSANPIVEDGRVTGIEGFLIDTTDFRLAEKELAAARREFEDLFALIPDLACIASTDGFLKKINPAWQTVLGYGPEKLLATPFLEFVHPEDREATLAEVQARVEDTGPGVFANRCLRSDGTYRWIEWRSAPFAGHAIFTIGRDVTERNRFEDALQESERRFREILSNVHMVAITLDRDGSITFCNDFLLGLTGWKREEVLGRNWFELFIDPEQAEIRETFLGAIDKGEIPAHYENDILTRSGQKRRIAWNNTLLRGPAGEAAGSASIGEDITDRNRAQKELQESEERFRGMANNLPGIVYQFFARDNGEWGLYYVGGRSEAVFGLAHDPLSSWFERFMICVAAEDRGKIIASIEESVRKHSAWECEVRFIKPSGEELFIRGVSQPQRMANETVFNGILLDITDRKRLEDQFRQAQKLESVGRLAGGVAHDFNNLLTVINGYSGFLLNALNSRDPLRKYAEEISSAGERAAGLTAQLLAFSRKQIIEPKPLDLNAFVKDTHKMLRRLIGEDIELVTSLSPGIGKIMADPDQVHQVLMNLLVNARDAMPDGGKITIGTAEFEVDGSGASFDPEEAPGRYVVLTVSDTGTGMDEHTRLNIFEPFFTTKEQGKGTGLGLSTVYGIVKQGGGWIAVDSKAGRGSTFRVHWPRIGDRASTQAAVNAEPTIRGGAETVLVVEDQAEVRSLTKAILSAYGYCVIEAVDGAEALRIAGEHPGPIHLLLTDVVMPGMNGREVADAFFRLLPGIRVLYISGYTADVIACRGVLDSGIAYLPKPFSPAALAEKVREVLDRV